MNEKNFKQPLVFFFNGVISIISCNCYVSWSAERTVNRRHNMYNYFLSDSIYASTSERFHNNLRLTLKGLGKSILAFTHLCKVRFVIENFSIISSALIKSLSVIFSTPHFIWKKKITEINTKKKKKKVLTRHYKKS